MYDQLSAEYRASWEDVFHRIPWRQLVRLRGVAAQRHYDRLRERTQVRHIEKPLPPAILTPLRVGKHVDMKLWTAAQKRRHARQAVADAGGVAAFNAQRREP